jgi:hypothetical protein
MKGTIEILPYQQKVIPYKYELTMNWLSGNFRNRYSDLGVQAFPSAHACTPKSGLFHGKVWRTDEFRHEG